MEQYGLVGFPLAHSFSKRYFSDKFEKAGLADRFCYNLFELENIEQFRALFTQNRELRGVNVTIPYKKLVCELLDGLDHSAELVGAVNVVKRTDENKLIGYNSDYYGFKRSLLENLGKSPYANIRALVLGGSGGAAKAVVAVLNSLQIPFQLVGRSTSEQTINYTESDSLINSHSLIINCTPLGTFPKIDSAPAIDYTQLTANHFLFDLVYNPSETLFMKKGLEKGALVKNGYDMLVYQAEKSWEIWRQDANISIPINRI